MWCETKSSPHLIVRGNPLWGECFWSPSPFYVFKNKSLVEVTIMSTITDEEVWFWHGEPSGDTSRFYLCFQTHHKESCSVEKRGRNTMEKKAQKMMWIWLKLKLNPPLRWVYCSLCWVYRFPWGKRLIWGYLWNKYVPRFPKQNKKKVKIETLSSPCV